MRQRREAKLESNWRGEIKNFNGAREKEGTVGDTRAAAKRDPRGI